MDKIFQTKNANTFFSAKRMARSKFKGERPNSTKVHEIKVKGASKANKVKVSSIH